jgi:hypothetical protein
MITNISSTAVNLELPEESLSEQEKELLVKIRDIALRMIDTVCACLACFPEKCLRNFSRQEETVSPKITCYVNNLVSHDKNAKAAEFVQGLIKIQVASFRYFLENPQPQIEDIRRIEKKTCWVLAYRFLQSNLQGESSAQTKAARCYIQGFIDKKIEKLKSLQAPVESLESLISFCIIANLQDLNAQNDFAKHIRPDLFSIIHTIKAQRYQELLRELAIFSDFDWVMEA